MNEKTKIKIKHTQLQTIPPGRRRESDVMAVSIF